MIWPAIITGAITVAGIGGLVYYRLNRKFKKETVRGMWNFLDRNIVELIVGMVLIPDWKLLIELLK